MYSSNSFLNRHFVKNVFTFASFLDRFWIVFGSFLDCFWIVFGSFLDRFWIVFGSFLGRFLHIYLLTESKFDIVFRVKKFKSICVF